MPDEYLARGLARQQRPRDKSLPVPELPTEGGRMTRKLRMILDAAPNPWCAIFALRLLLSPSSMRREWYAVGYRFPWERA